MTYAETHAGCLGGSEVVAVLGFSAYKTPLDIWAEKRKLVEPKDESDETTERGNEEEEGCVQYAERRLERGLLRQGRGYDVPIVVGHLGVSPDALPFWYGSNGAVPPFGVEAKTRQYSRGWGDDMSSDVPIDVATQCHAYMAALGSPRWYVSVLFGVPLCRRLYVLERDESRCQRILALVESWWNKHIVAGEPPSSAVVEDRSRLARILHPAAGKDVIRISTPEVCDLMNRRREVEIEREQWQDLGKDVERRWRELGGQIEELIGSAAGIETPVGSAFLNSRSSRGRLVTKWPGERNQ